MNRGHKQTDVIVMDFAKAFDKVPPQVQNIPDNKALKQVSIYVVSA